MAAQKSAARGAQSGPFVGRKKTANITPGAIANATTVDVAFPFVGAKPGDGVSVTFGSALVAGILFVGASIAADDSVTLRFSNITGAPVTQVQISTTVNLSKNAG